MFIYFFQKLEKLYGRILFAFFKYIGRVIRQEKNKLVNFQK